MVLSDLAISWRKVKRRPLAALLAVASLALAIGFCTAAFSVVDAYYWRALPVKDPGQLEYLLARDREGRFDEINWSEFRAIAEQGRAITGIAVEDRRGPTLKLPDRLEFPITAGVSNGYFDVLGVRAALGRVFHAGDAAEGEVVMSDKFWHTVFGGDPAICGKTITLGGTALAVIGVLPPGFSGPNRGLMVDLFVPEPVMFGALHLDSPTALPASFQPIVRLRAGVDRETARKEVDELFRRIESAGLAPGPARKAVLVSFLRPYLKPETNAADIFPWIALVVLLIAAANFAGLRLVESQEGRRETGIRLALGAGRASLFRQHLSESLLVAGVAAGLGLLIAQWLIDLAPAILYGSRSHTEYFIRLDARVFAFSAGAMLLIAAFGALIPMRDTWRCQVVPALQALVAPSAARWLAALVILQIGLITAFADSAALLWKSLHNVAAIRPAMDPDRRLLMIEGFWNTRRAAAPGAADSLTATLGAVPGVLRAAYCRRVMMQGSGGGARVEFEQPGQPKATFRYNQVSPGYFAATGARLLAGRTFTEADGPGATPVALVSQAFVSKFFPAGDALYHWARIGGTDRQIVGIVEDGPANSLKETIEPFFYFPFAQMPTTESVLLLDVAGNPSRTFASVRDQLRRSNSGFVPRNTTTLAQHLTSQRTDEELAADVSGLLAGLGLALAAAGLLGVTLHAVGRRTREFGIRVAVGATPGVLSRDVLRGAMRMAAAGLALGVVLCIAFLRLLQSYLYGVKPQNLAAFGFAVAVVTLVALAAAAIPARRAARADPMSALRTE